MLRNRLYLNLLFVLAFGLALGLTGCVGQTGSEGKKLSCYDDGQSGILCSETDGEGEGGEHEGDAPVCEDEGCITECHDGEGDAHVCVTECEGGLRCVEECHGDDCAMECACPEGDTGEGGESDHEAYCTEHPDDPECKDGGDGGDDGGTDHETYCTEHPDDPECKDGGDGGGDGGTDHETYCKEHPDDPECV